MKKLLVAILALALCLSVFAAGAVAAGETYTIHIDVSEVGWENLNVYYWGAGSCSWPGDAATEKDSDGWYTFEVPVGAQGLVLNNGSTQTIDLNTNNGMLLDQECWIIVKEEQDGGKHKFACSATKPAEGEEIKPVDPTAPAIEYMEVVGSGLEGITWTPGSSVRMENPSDGIFTATFTSVPAGDYVIKFAANGNWSDYNFGGTFAAFGEATDAAWNSSDITFTVAETCDITITLDLTGFDYTSKTGAKFTVASGVAQPEPEPAGTINVHVIAPAEWVEVYVYTFNPEQNGTWPGTKVENGVIAVTANFEGLIVNNNSGNQTANITTIDLTKTDVWVVVAADCSYTLHYEDPGDVTPDPVANIRVHVIAPESWAEVYVYTFNPQNNGNWPGTKVEFGYLDIPANFEGLIVNNNNGTQTADIKDIDLTAEEVWITVAEDGSYTISYKAPDAGGNQPDTGDTTIIVSTLLALLAGAGMVTVIARKKEL